MKLFLSIFIIMITFILNAQDVDSKWELGGGVRLNYLGLDGGFSGYRVSDGYGFEIKYKEIGMDNYSPSLALTIGGKYKKWNLFFAGSQGSYKGEFETKFDIVRDDVVIDSGAVVNGSIDMDIYSLSTTFNIIEKQHDFGVGIGFLILNMGSSYQTTDVTGKIVDLGGDNLFPMPFLAISGRLNFGDIRFAGSGGGAYFNGNYDGMDYEVFYYTIDARGTYDFYEGDNWSSSVSIGFRNLFMDMDASNETGWVKEHDVYSGPYMSLRIKFSSTETY